MAQNPKPIRRWWRFLKGPVEVIEPLPVYTFVAGGWGDGFLTMPVGARIFLTHMRNGYVFYQPLAGGPWDQEGGSFFRSDLGKVRRLRWVHLGGQQGGRDG